MNHLRAKIIAMASASGEGHVPSAFSILDILWVLYDRVLNITAHNIDDPERNRFILSKGHASIGLYVVLAEKGIIDPKLLDRYCKFDNPLGGHPDRTKVPGVESSTGSLGHGLPMAVGLALGAKIKKSPAKVYAIVGDGECNEGTIWEAAMLAAHHKLDNLYCIVDYNHSSDRALVLGDLRSKFEAFGWQTTSIDGHDQEMIYQALTKTGEGQPLAIIANTIKGRGLKIMENNTEWHHKSPNEEQKKAMLQELQ